MSAFCRLFAGTDRARDSTLRLGLGHCTAVSLLARTPNSSRQFKVTVRLNEIRVLGMTAKLFRGIWTELIIASLAAYSGGASCGLLSRVGSGGTGFTIGTDIGTGFGSVIIDDTSYPTPRRPTIPPATRVLHCSYPQPWPRSGNKSKWPQMPVPRRDKTIPKWSIRSPRSPRRALPSPTLKRV